jgi:hypothetical protein
MLIWEHVGPKAGYIVRFPANRRGRLRLEKLITARAICAMAADAGDPSSNALTMNMGQIL